MKLINKLGLLVSMAFLASCDYLPKGEDPADDTKLLFRGLDSSNPDDRQRLDSIFAQLTSNKGDNRFNRGFGAGIVQALLEGGIDTPTDPKAILEQRSDPRCEAAKVAKVAFHVNQGTGVPDNFGKITDMKLREYRPGYWAGHIELCTWIKNGASRDEYFFHIDFKGELEGLTVKTNENTGNQNDPFPDTLELGNLIEAQGILDMMNMWQYKLHGKKDAIQISNAWKNGVLLPPSHPAYINDQDCFDIFLDAAGLASMQAGILPAQNGYCMGRCDGYIMNTK